MSDYNMIFKSVGCGHDIDLYNEMTFDYKPP